MTDTATTTSGGDRVPLSSMRRRIAKHMAASKATSPHVAMATEIDYGAIDRVRRTAGPAWREAEGIGLTYLPFVAWAVCRALECYPQLNAWIDGNDLVLHRGVHLGIAVDLDFEGLIVPVVQQADERTVTELARSIRQLSDLARARKLTVDAVQGGTYTITNAGPFGTFFTAPIINQPQVAILSTDGVRKRPMVVEGADGDEIAIRPGGLMVQSFDHRAVDGAYSAAFLKELKTVVECTDWDVELAR